MVLAAASRLFWVAPAPSLGPAQVEKLVASARSMGFHEIVLSTQQADSLPTALLHPSILRTGDSYAFDGQTIAYHLRIEGTQGQAVALSTLGSIPIVVIETTDWSVIPWENLIAAGQSRPGSRIVVVVSSVSQAEVALGSLERGVGGVLLLVTDAQQIEALAKLRKAATPHVPLELATIESVSIVGSGDRICVDTCSILRPGEGLLVGSQSQALFLLHGETVGSSYVATRPFRINAGPVHAYVLMPDGSTCYLSELHAGMSILLVDADGRSRTAVIGRIKQEVRPLALVSARVGETALHTIVQNAETIRFLASAASGPGGPVARAVTELKRGDQVLVHLTDGARHFGMLIDESLQER